MFETADKYFQEHPEHNWFGLKRFDISNLTLVDEVNGYGNFKQGWAFGLQLLSPRGLRFYHKLRRFVGLDK